MKFLRDRNAKVDFLVNHDIPRVERELEHQGLTRPNTWFSCAVEYLCATSKKIAKLCRQFLIPDYLSFKF